MTDIALKEGEWYWVRHQSFEVASQLDVGSFAIHPRLIAVASHCEVLCRIPPPEELATIRLALETITRGEGPFSMDHTTHAENCIEAMKEEAKKALAILDIAAIGRPE